MIEIEVGEITQQMPPTKVIPPTELVRLFIYGTLMTGEQLNPVLQGSPFIGKAITSVGYTLVDLGEFPGLIKFENTIKVAGELYDVSPQRLATIDQIESEGYLYRRLPLITTLVETNEEEEVSAYILHPHMLQGISPNKIKKSTLSSPNIEEIGNDTVRWRYRHIH